MSTAERQTSKPLSTAYVVRLQPDTQLRLLVICSGWLLLLLGTLLLLHLAVPVLLRLALVVIWLADSGFELHRFARSQASVATLLLRGDGACAACDARGREQALTLMNGSVVLASLAWLRFRRSDRTTYTELYRRGDQDADTWRRLQVVWRWAAVQRRLANDN